MHKTLWYGVGVSLLAHGMAGFLFQVNIPSERYTHRHYPKVVFMGEFLERGTLDFALKHSVLNIWHAEDAALETMLARAAEAHAREKELFVDTPVVPARALTRLPDIPVTSPKPTIQIAIADYTLESSLKVREDRYGEQALKAVYKPDLKNIITPLDLLEMSVAGVQEDHFKTELRAKIDTIGRVAHVEIETSSGMPLVDAFCVRYLEKWRFQPRENAQPQWINVNINLDLGKLR